MDRVTRLIGRVCDGTSSGRDGRPVAPRMVKCLLMPRCQRWCAAYSYGPCGDRNAGMRSRAAPCLLFEVGRVRRRDARSVHSERCLGSAKRARRERAGADGQRQDGDAPHCRPLLPTAPLGDQRALRTLFLSRCKEVSASVATATANTRAAARNVSRSLRRRMWTCLNEKPGRKSPGPAARGDSSRTTAMPWTSSYFYTLLTTTPGGVARASKFTVSK